MRSSNFGSSPREASSGGLPTVLILGCGWLGTALAHELVAAGHQVIGTTTSPENIDDLQAAGIQMHLLQLGPSFGAAGEALLLQLLSQVDVLVLNVPPRSASTGGYPSMLRPVHRAVAAAGTPHVLFVSSTSVYPKEPRVMRETDAISTRDAASDILRAEGHFVPRYGQWKSTVVRPGGLIGPGRAPGRFMAGRRDLPNGHSPVNLVHLTDVVGVLTAIIQHTVWGHTFNVCSAQHPLQRDFYPAAARFLKLEAPTFKDEPELTGKTVDSLLVRRLVPYVFQHDDLMAALAYC